jgi:hypothetical protein
MSIYKKLREATKEIQKKTSKPKFVVRPMSQADIQKGEKIRKGELMSDEEYESEGGDRPDLEKK